MIIINYDPIYLTCEICKKKFKGLIGLSSHVCQNDDHPTYEEYLKLYPIEKHIKIQMRHIFLKSFEIKESGCWEWNGELDKDGYGKIYAFSKRVSAHRFSYEIFNGIIEPEMFVCHSCDNPCCVNPDHLWLGTTQENTQDSVNKGRRDYLYGDTNPAKRKSVRKKISKILKGKSRPSLIGNKNNIPMFGDNNPMSKPEVVRRCVESRRRNKYGK